MFGLDPDPYQCSVWILIRNEFFRLRSESGRDLWFFVVVDDGLGMCAGEPDLPHHLHHRHRLHHHRPHDCLACGDRYPTFFHNKYHKKVYIKKCSYKNKKK